MKSHQQPHQAWLSAFFALFMVLFLPACMYGALSRTDPSWSSSNSNEEERHEHGVRKLAGLESRNKRMPVPRVRAVRTPLVRPLPTVAPREMVIVASVAPALEPSRFSVRRLR